MSCCGSSNQIRSKKQIVAASEKQTVKQVTISKGPKPASIERQMLTPRQKCIKCGFPTMAVYIANRERIQCSNANCRAIIK